MTTRRSRGISTEMFRRLCTRAPWTATVSRAMGFGVLLDGVERFAVLEPFEPLEGIGGFGEIDERELLDARGALLREAAGDRDLSDEALIREILACGGHAVHVEVADEVVLDVAARPGLADFAQVIEHRSE